MTVSTLASWDVQAMNAPLPPIDCDCRRLLLHTEAVAQRFSRYQKCNEGPI